MAKKLFSIVKKYLPLLGLSIFLYLIFSLDTGKIINAVLSIPLVYIVLASVLVIPTVLIRNAAWMLIHKEQKINIGFFQSLKIFLMGYFYGSISPGYIGQLMRVPYLKEKTGEPSGKLFVNSVIETIVHTLSLYAMMILGAFLIVGSHPVLFMIVSAWVVILAVVLLFFIKKERGEKLFYQLIRYLTPKQFKTYLTRFVDTFYADFPKLRTLIAPLILGSFTWIIMFSQEYLIVLALGATIPYLYFLLLFPIANTAGFIPITFAGLGVREVTSIFLFSTLFGVDKEIVFVFTLVGFLITDILTGFIGFLLTLTEMKEKRGMTLRKV
jgi:uncharacterized protein (TIRG00374 family)